MERSRRLAEVWNWLIPFRAVAEHESLAEASKSLRVASSALSRSVKLLEEQIGVPLFERTPSGLKLTGAGVTLLRDLRQSMRQLDETLTEIAGKPEVAVLTISAPLELSPLLLPLLTSVTTARLRWLELRQNEALASLRRGSVDIAVVDRTCTSQELAFVEVPSLPRAVFGEGPRYAVPLDERGQPRDGFPNVLDREFGLVANEGGAVLNALRSGLRAVLVTHVGERLGHKADEHIAVEPLELALATRIALQERESPHQKICLKLLQALDGELSR